MLGKLIKKYKLTITAILSVLGTFAAMTFTPVDDTLVAAAKTVVEQVAPANQ